MFKRLCAVFVLAVLMTSICSCKDKGVEYCELGIMLPDDFEEYDSVGAFDVAYSNKEIIVGFSRLSFVDCVESGLLTTWSPYKLATVYLDKMDKPTDSGVEQHGDVPYFTYTSVDGQGNSYFYMPTFYRTQYAYFVVTFITPSSNKVVGRAEIFKYIDTVYIKEQDLQ